MRAAAAASKNSQPSGSSETLPGKAYRQTMASVAMGGTSFITSDVQSAIKASNPQVEEAVLRGAQDAVRALKPSELPPAEH